MNKKQLEMELICRNDNEIPNIFSLPLDKIKAVIKAGVGGPDSVQYPENIKWYKFRLKSKLPPIEYKVIYTGKD